MNIEICTPQAEVPEHNLFYLRGKLMDFYHRFNRIEKVEVVLKHQHISTGNDFVCEVTFRAREELFMIHRSGESYLQAIREVIKEMGVLIEELVERRDELPDQIISTVRV